MTKIVIAGAGPAALLMANFLIRHYDNDCEIVMLERRSDPRTVPPIELRTFPITIQSRGMNAISSIDPGLKDALERVGTYVCGMCLHNGKTPRVISSLKSLSLDRNSIALTLLEELEKLTLEKYNKNTLDIRFQCSVEAIDFEKKKVIVVGKEKSDTIDFDILIAADGARSKIRQQLKEDGFMDYSQVNVRDDYRTIHFARTAPDGETLLPGRIHGQMSNGIQLIGVPIHPECASGAFVFPRDKDPLEGMKTGAEVKAFFESFSPYFAGKFVTDDEAEALLQRPVSSLVSVRCDRLAVGGCVLLIGDAAHAVSASIGQGLNSALQDVQVFAAHLDEQGDDWAKALDSYSAARLPDAHAVEELSYNAMPKSKIMLFEFLFRTILNKILPTWTRTWFRRLPIMMITETDYSYSKILEECQWWVDRVKASSQSQSQSPSKSKTV